MVDICIYSPASRGGAGWFVASLAQAIADGGARILLVCPALVPAGREPSGTHVERHILIAGTAGQGSLPVRIGRTLWRILSTFPLLLRARFRTRNYLVTMFDWIPVLVAQFLFIRLIGGRIIFVVHDATPHAWAFPERLRGLERRLYRMSYHLPQQIVSLTGAAHRELAQEWGRVADSHIIPHGAHLDTAPQQPLPGHHVVLVFGMLRRNKRIRESIEAMRLLAEEGTDLSMVIAGEPHVDDMDYWRDCERALVGLERYVSTEVGFIPDARVRELLDQADAMLLPYEQFNSQSGVAIMGSLAERVVLATNVGGVGELIAMGLRAVPIERPVSAGSIADALRQFRGMTVEERRAAATESRLALEAGLSWGRIGRSYIGLIGSTDPVSNEQ